MTQAQQQGAAGCMCTAGGGAHQRSCPLCTSLPASSETDTLLLLPTVLPIAAPPGTPGRQGQQGQQGDVHFCRKSWWGRG